MLDAKQGVACSNHAGVDFFILPTDLHLLTILVSILSHLEDTNNLVSISRHFLDTKLL